MIIEMQEISFRKDILPLKDKLFRLALRITLDRAEAEDVVQDVLLKAWNKRDEWTDLLSVEAYCRVMTKNLAIDRRRVKESQTVELTSEMEEVLDSCSPHEQLVHEEKMNLINRLVNELPEQQRLVLQLRDVEGESYKKIASLLHLTEEQVKVYLFRARQKVRKRFLEIDGYGL
ncbi:sigma-70, region 4 family [gut metagenome]|uniref:Sigma-70, region 4 family n=1 Tax=gut metagenome TaxID=749906 RepID=J9C1B1_9ZZZZ